MNHLQKLLALAAVALAAAPGLAQAAYVLDTGTPPASTTGALVLDPMDYVAAEFSLGAGQTISSIEGFIMGGDFGSPGTTFTISLYGNNGGVPDTNNLLYTAQATYQADGWNGLSGLSLSGLSAGNYWAAFEVGASDTASPLLLPVGATGGTASALAFAFSDTGWQYSPMSGENFGVQVATATPVPLPGALVLLASGMLGVGGFARKRSAA